jgi:light-harvesting complex I chlorophyll a/b binding protein 1
VARKLLLLVGTFETIGGKQIYEMQMEGSGRKAGDFGFDPLMLLKLPNAEKYKLAELTHGRAAMIAFSGAVTHSALPDAFGFGKAVFPYFCAGRMKRSVLAALVNIKPISLCDRYRPCS